MKSTEPGIYFLHWSTPMVSNYSGQADKPVAYTEELGAITIRSKGEFTELPDQYQRKMRTIYNQVKMSAPSTRGVIISDKGNYKTATRQLVRILEARASEEALAKRKRKYVG